MEDRVGFAIFLPSQILNGVDSVFSAKLYTVKTAIEELFENIESYSYIIFSDFHQDFISDVCNSTYGIIYSCNTMSRLEKCMPNCVGSQGIVV